MLDLSNVSPEPSCDQGDLIMQQLAIQTVGAHSQAGPRMGWEAMECQVLFPGVLHFPDITSKHIVLPGRGAKYHPGIPPMKRKIVVWGVYF